MLQRIKVTEQIDSTAILQYKGNKNVVDIISIVSEEIGAANIHYIQGAGMVYCFGGSCCQYEGKPAKPKYIYPVVHYSFYNDPTKQIQDQYGGPIKIKFMKASGQQHEELQTKGKLQGGLVGKDMYVICNDTNFQDLTFELMGQAKWTQDENLKALVEQSMFTYDKMIDLCVATVHDDNTLLQVLQAAAAKQTQIPQLGRPAMNMPQVPTARNPQISMAGLPSYGVMNQPAQPVAQPSLPSFNQLPNIPVAQVAQPAAQPAQPVVLPTQPIPQAAQPAQPVVLPTQPIPQAAQPAAQPAQPVVLPTQPIPQAAQLKLENLAQQPEVVSDDDYEFDSLLSQVEAPPEG